MTAGSPISEPLDAVRDQLLALGNVLPELRSALAGSLRSTAAAEPGPAALASAGPRTAGNPAEYELLLEMIREGYLLHYGRSRCLGDIDPDLALLLGDGLYALGLARLAGLGDLEAVGELGDLISLVAQAHVRTNGELAEAVWTAVAVSVGWGSDENLRRAKQLAREGAAGASLALGQAADARRANVRFDDAPRLEGDNL